MSNMSDELSMKTNGATNGATNGTNGANGATNVKENNTEMTLDDLNSNLNNCIQKLNEDLKSKLSEINFQTNSIQDICQEISKINLLGEFDKEFYNNLNKYFKQNPDSSKNVMVGEFLGQVPYAQIINGKYGQPWPSAAQKKIIENSLGKSMTEKALSIFGFGGSKKIIKNKKKYINKKYIK